MPTPITPQEQLQIAALLGGMALLICFSVAYVCHFFVALTARPSARAGWLAGLGYVASVAVLIFIPLTVLWVPLAALPGAAFTYWYWYSGLKAAWVDDPADLPEGVELEEDDWRIGLMKLLALIVLGSIAAAIKWVSRTYWGG